MRALVAATLLVSTVSWCANGQESQSRPATRPTAEVTAAEWQEWMEGLRLKANPDPFLAAAHEADIAGFAASRLADCGAKPAFDKKGEKPSLLQAVPFVVAGYDPKETFIESVGATTSVRVVYGAGFGARGVDFLDVSGPVRYYRGDATSERVELPKPLDLDDLGLIGKIIKDAGGKLERPLTFEIKNHVVFAVPLNNQQNPTAVPKFARGLRARGATAVLFVEDQGTKATTPPHAITRRDRFKPMAKEDPPALFLTTAATRELEKADRVAVKVRHRTKNLDIPNVVARIEGKDSKQAVLVSAGAGDSEACAALIAATKILARMPEAPNRTILFAICSQPHVELGGQEWFLGHSPVPLGRIVAAIHLDASAGSDPGSDAGTPHTVHAARGCPALETAAKEAVERMGGSRGAAGGPKSLRSVDDFAKRGIPAIGIARFSETFEGGLLAGKIAADLARVIADRPERPALAPR